MFKFQLFLLLFSLLNFIFPQSNEELKDFARKYFERFELPSLSIAMQKDGEIFFNESFGFADLENRIAATDSSVYRIASISKSITAVAIMQLVEGGKIKLDEDVRKYLPDFPKKKWVFTVRQILNHTSGLRTYRANEFHSTKKFSSIKETVDFIKDDSLMCQPGTFYLYSTLSYNLLARIIENVTKKSFEEYIQENILTKAGMLNTYFDHHSRVIPNRARGYEKDSLRQIINSALADLTIKFPGGGVLSTTKDLLKFSTALLDGKLISRNWLDTMLVKTKLKNGRVINYGLGLVSNKDEFQLEYFGHTGAGTGFVSNIIIYPNKNFSAVHLINLRDRLSLNPAQLLARKFFGEDVDLPKMPASEKLFQITIQHPIDSAIAFYKLISDDSADIYITGMDELRIFGSDLLSAGKITDALIVFNILTIENPNYVDGFLGLGDAYLKDNNKGLALRAYRKALAIIPNHPYALKKIKEITS